MDEDNTYVNATQSHIVEVLMAEAIDRADINFPIENLWEKAQRLCPKKYEKIISNNGTPESDDALLDFIGYDASVVNNNPALPYKRICIDITASNSVVTSLNKEKKQVRNDELINFLKEVDAIPLIVHVNEEYINRLNNVGMLPEFFKALTKMKHRTFKDYDVLVFRHDEAAGYNLAKSLGVDTFDLLKPNYKRALTQNGRCD